jgi:hypothetical protein
MNDYPQQFWNNVRALSHDKWCDCLDGRTQRCNCHLSEAIDLAESCARELDKLWRAVESEPL